MIVRSIQPEDNAAIAAIIRTVMPEFGASGQGFAIHDKEVDDMFASYTQPRTAYKKMYFLPEGRGKGLGQQVLDACLKAAREIGYTYCYLETFNTMTLAMKLYAKNGFEKIPGPCGNTGHFACDTFYRKKLR